MNLNNLAQWVMFFYVYSFLGWIWECFYVSVRQRKWVNRGFLNGPALPIYGFGAISVLLITLPVEDNIYLVYIMGMIGATLLEYITGSLMERIFHVRYWDYSTQPFNLNGHICLGCSLGWGLFSVLMVNVIHKPIKQTVEKIPETTLNITTVIITIVFVADVIWSVNEALDLKKVILEEAEKNRQLQYIHKRMEEIADLWNENMEKYKGKTVSWKKELEEERSRLANDLALLKVSKEEMDRKLRHTAHILKRNPSLQAPRHEKVLKNIRDLLEKKR